jgi:hypothetical protein
MKTIILGFTCLLFLGCEKYSQPSIPSLTGDKWIFYDYDIVITNAINEVKVIKTDTICINSFNEQSFISGNFLMRQNYDKTAIDRRFVVNKTMWEFGSNNYHLYCEFGLKDGGLRPNHEPFWVSVYPLLGYLEVNNNQNGGRTVYTYETNANGAFPPSKLTLLSPQIVTDLYYSNGSREKAVTVRVLLKFMR